MTPACHLHGWPPHPASPVAATASSAAWMNREASLPLLLLPLRWSPWRSRGSETTTTTTLGDSASELIYQQQVWKANLDSAPLGTSYSGGSTDRPIDWTTTIRQSLQVTVNSCNSSSLPASLLAPGLPS